MRNADPSRSARVCGFRHRKASIIQRLGYGKIAPDILVECHSYLRVAVVEKGRNERPRGAVGVAIKGEFAIVADSIGVRVIRVLIPAWLAH